MLLIKIELTLAILSLLGSTRTDSQALPPLTTASFTALRIVMCRAEDTLSAEIEILNAGDEIPPTDRKKIAEVLQQATEELRLLKGSLRYQTLADIAVLQTQIGEDASAKENFARVKASNGGFNTQPRELAVTSARIRDLVVAHARAGDLATVLTLTANLPQTVPNHRGAFRDSVLSQCASELAKSLRIKEARQVVEEMEDPKQKVLATNRAQIRYVEALAKAGRLKEANQMMASVLDPGQKVAMLAGNLVNYFTFLDYPQDPGIATFQARAGNRQAAEQSLRLAGSLLPSIPDSQRDRLTAAVCAAYSQLGDTENASRLLKGVKEERYRSYAMAAYVKCLALAGKPQEAERILDSLQNEDLVHALYHYAVGQFKARDREGAKQSIAKASASLNGLKKKGTHVYNLLSAQAMAGDIAGALAKLERNPGSESLQISNIAWALVLAGDFQGACDVTNRLLPSGQRGMSLRTIARAQGAGGKETDARGWIKQQVSAEDKADALLGLAEGLIERAKSRSRN